MFGGRSRGAPIYEKTRRGPYWIPPRALGGYAFLYPRYGRNTFEVLKEEGGGVVWWYVGGRGGERPAETYADPTRVTLINIVAVIYLSKTTTGQRACGHYNYFSFCPHTFIEASDDDGISAKASRVVASSPRPPPALLAGCYPCEILKLQKPTSIGLYI